jgi:DNA-binding MarR family transcriptional regulator
VSHAKMLLTTKLFGATIASLVTEAAIHSLDSEDEEMTVTQYHALRYIRLHNNPSAGELAEALQISNAAVTKLIDRLEKKELVIRGSHPSDRRTMRLQLSAKGLKISKRLSETEQANFSQIVARMDPGEIEAFKSGMEGFLKAALITPEQIDRICQRCGCEHIEDCLGNLQYARLTGLPKKNV